MSRSAVKLHADARAEVLEAHRWYSERSAGAGDAFLLELDLALNEISKAPEAWPRDVRGTRRFVLHRFPHVIVYRRMRSDIQIIAVALPRDGRVSGGPGSAEPSAR